MNICPFYITYLRAPKTGTGTPPDNALVMVTGETTRIAQTPPVLSTTTHSNPTMQPVCHQVSCQHRTAWTAATNPDRQSRTCPDGGEPSNSRTRKVGTDRSSDPRCRIHGSHGMDNPHIHATTHMPRKSGSACGLLSMISSICPMISSERRSTSANAAMFSFTCSGRDAPVITVDT